VAQRLEGSCAVRGSLGEVTTQTDKDFRATVEHRVNCFHHVVTVFAWHFELEAPFQCIEKERWWALVDAHGAVALHVTVATHWTQAGTRPAEVAAQQHQVGDFLDGRYRMAMLGDAHRPAHD